MLDKWIDEETCNEMSDEEYAIFMEDFSNWVEDQIVFEEN